MATGESHAVVFDIDGTLIDSNYLHVDAWQHALQQLGHDVPAWRVHRAIGMGSDKLLPLLIGESAAAEHGEDARLLHSAFFGAHGHRLRRLPAARELLSAVREAGLQVVLATSAAPRELAQLLEALDSDAPSVVTSSDDVDDTKPDPDVLGVALGKAGVAAKHAIFVGDAVWDVRASVRAGIRCVGVRSGGTSGEELLREGAVAVYDDPAGILGDADDDPLGLRIAV